MKVNMRKMLACLLALCTIVSCSQDAEDVLAGQDGTASSKDIRKVLNSVSKEWGKSRDALINEMEGYYLVEGTREDMLQFKHPKKEQCISYQLKEEKLCGSVALLPTASLESDILSVLKEYKYLGELSGADIYGSNDANIMASVWKPVDADGVYCAIGFAPIRSDAFENIEPIIVTVSDARNVTAEKAEIGGTVTGYSGNVTCGVLYSVNSDMSSAIKKTKKATGAFSFEINGLRNNTVYYYQAFAIIDGITYYSNVVSFQTEFVQTYNIGDWYPDYNNREGVVFYTSNNGVHGMIVSLDYDFLYWDTETLFAQKRGCTSTTDGYTNTNKMPKSSSRILAGPWCLNHGTGWYCPARGELVTLANNVNKVNSTLASGGYHKLDTHFWSSTESSSDKAYVVTLGAMSSSDYVGNYYAVSKGQNYHVCAIKQF